MEVSGTVLRHTNYIFGVGTHTRSHGVVPRRVRMSMGSGFHDEGHVQYYQDVKKNTEPVIISNKKKIKLLKRFSKNVSQLPQLGFAQDPNLLDQLHQNLITVLFSPLFLLFLFLLFEFQHSSGCQLKICVFFLFLFLSSLYTTNSNYD